MQGAQAIVVGADALLSGRIFEAMQTPGLQLFQIPFSGHEWLKKSMLPDGCAACNIYTHGSTIAEYVMAAMLYFEIQLTEIDADFKTGSWRFGGSAGIGQRHGELAGKTLGLVGYGDIGQGIARRAHAFDMQVIATARTRREAPPLLQWLGGASDLDELLARSDYVVLACPANDETTGLINKGKLAKMKPSSVLINVARGQVCVEEDLFNALDSRTIAGAVLDTWYEYPTPENPNPKPSKMPFEKLKNVVMTPHCAAWSEAHHQRRWAKVAGNLDRLVSNLELENRIF
jgi:phosphoglycerate dehydrogenase-like enzyme